METENLPKEEWLVVSDLHLAAGERLPDGKPNPHEFFKGEGGGDRAFRRMLRLFVREARGRKAGLRLLGDILDFHAIPHRGSFRYAPTEEAALAKLEACLAGHPVFFESLRDFLAEPEREIVWHIGNHDQDLAWESVQEAIRRRVDPHGASGDRLRFVYDETDGDTWYFHGDVLEPISTIPKPENMFITAKADARPAVIAAVLLFLTYPTLVAAAKSLLIWNFRFEMWDLVLAVVGFLAFSSVLSWGVHKLFFLKWGRERKFLNAPTSTYMNSWLGQRLRTRLPWIGRMRNHGALWFLSLIHNWLFALVAFPLLVIYFYWHRFVVEPVDARRQQKRASFTFLETLRLLGSTMGGDAPMDILKRLAEEKEGVRNFVCGHTHVPELRKLELQDGREIFYRNTGTGVHLVRVTISQVECRTKHRRLEAFLRRIGVYWKKRPGRGLALVAAHALMAGGIYSFGVWVGNYASSTAAFFIAWMAIPVAVLSLLTRQSYAQYLAEEFTEFTPIRVRKYEDGRREFDHLRYQAAENAFVDALNA